MPKMKQYQCPKLTDWECPLSDVTAEVLMTANRYQYFDNIRRKHRNDGLVFDEKLHTVVGVDGDLAVQCDSMAHIRLTDPQISENERECLKVMIRSDHSIMNLLYVCNL